MGWGLLERSTGRACAWPRPGKGSLFRRGRHAARRQPGRVLFTGRRGWLAVVTLAGVATATPLAAGAGTSAAATPLLSHCAGFGGCSVGGYTTHGYQNYEWTSWWRMDAGDNCTNYVAFVESTVFHAPTPGYLLGNAGDWPGNAAAHGVLVDHTPSVGAVAVWYGGASGIGPSGHVAVVEQVAPGGGQIEISQQHISSDPDGYEWTRLSVGGLGDGWMTWPDAFIHFTTGAQAAVPAATPAAPEAVPPAQDLIRNGAFSAGGGWSMWPHSNYTTYTGGGATSPYSGTRFAATNTTVAGGGFYQDVPMRISAGASVCADAEVVTVGRSPGARGEMVLWLLGGARAESAAVGFGPLAGGDAWTPITACVTATGTYRLLRVQFYDSPGTPTLGVDAVDAHLSLARDGSFQIGGAWRPSPRTSFSTQGARGATSAYEGGRFAAASSVAAGGGFYQDVPMPIGAGDTFCADARVVTVGPHAGARGQLVLWLLGDSAAEASGMTFGPLAGGSRWAPISTCVTARARHALLRIQFYVDPGASMLGVDAVDAHRSLAVDGGFDTAAGASAWSVAPHSNFATYLGGGHATIPLEGAGFGVTNTSTAAGGIYQDLHYAVPAGASFCVDAAVVTEGAHEGAHGVMVLWLLGGGHPEASAAAFGPLPGGNAWTRVATCITATTPADDVRIQFYPAGGAPTLGIDAVDLR